MSMSDVQRSDNPLSIAVLNCLRCRDGWPSEYELMSEVSDHFSFLKQEADDNLLLFQKHFILMNALYQLQQSLLAESVYLHISALEIRLEACSNNRPLSDLPDLARDQKLGNYYLDWDNFTEADADSVADLLTGFWQRYHGLDQQQEAMKILQLSDDQTSSPGSSSQQMLTDLSMAEITRAYRRLAAQHHPDRGGDSRQFIQVRQAYEVLSHYVRR